MDGARLVAAALAVLGPAAVLAGSLALLDGFRDADEAAATRNAGRVVNARVLEVDSAEAMDRMLAQRPPEVVVVGPSYANTDVKADLLAARLGLSRDDIALLSVPNSVGAHWYAVLKYRLFEAGHRPKLVVVVSGLQSMLLTTPLTEASFVNLEVQLPEGGDPVVDELLGSGGPLWWARLREQRGEVREAVFDALRAAPAAALFGVTRREATAALKVVFDDALVDMALYAGSANIAGGQAEPERFYSPDLLPAPEASFVPRVTELVRDHGARIVWVRPPMSPFVPPELDDVVLPGVQERAIELVEDRGGAFLDMRALPMSSAMFKNEDHMNLEGSRRFSEALAAALQDLDALHPSADPTAAGPLHVGVRVGVRTPEVRPAALPLPPGVLTPEGSPELRLEVEGWSELRGTFAVDVVLEPAEGGPAPVVTVAGAAVPLRAVDGRWIGSASPPSPGDAPFEVVVGVPAVGPPTRLVGLSLGRRRGRVFLVGDPSSFEGAVVRTLGLSRLVGGVLVDESVRPTYARDPVRPPNADRPVLDQPGEVAAYDTTRWTFLSDEALKGETSFGSRCSPLRVTEDGRLLGPANVPCTEVVRKGHGRSCHTLDRLFFTAPDGSDPASNGRTYRLALDPARACDDDAWIYPVDRLSLRFPPEGVATLARGGRFLRLSARYLNQRHAALVVRLVVDGRAVLEEEIDGPALDRAPFVRELAEPVPPTAAEVVVELESKDHVFYLLDDVSLSERRPSGADAPAP